MGVGVHQPRHEHVLIQMQMLPRPVLPGHLPGGPQGKDAAGVDGEGMIMEQAMGSNGDDPAGVKE
jgi:hypothetical protein